MTAWVTAGADKVRIGGTVFDASQASKSGASGRWKWQANSGYDNTKAVSSTNNSGTLTLSGYTLSYGRTSYTVSLPAGAVVRMNGKNKITNTGHNNVTSAIVADGDVMFTGTGSITAVDSKSSSGTKSSYTCGICIKGDIVMNDGNLKGKSMPVMDGYEAARKIRSLCRSDAGTVPIIAMTADAFNDDVEKCFEAGMNGHIAKPIDPEVMYKTIAEMIILSAKSDNTI